MVGKGSQFLWSLLRFVVGPWFRHKLNFTTEVCGLGGPLLVLSNHNTDLDPIALGLAFPRFMHFVASEHVFRMKWAGRLLDFFFKPISRTKGATAADTALKMVRTLKRGGNVAMFAEGNRSFNGLTGDILPATGKLARSCGATLVTYRMEGGYLSSPRWSGSKIRRGRLTGRIVGVYSPGELKAMSAAEVNDIIRRDLSCDAYADQRREPVRYKSSSPALGLERLLCLCPRCGRTSTLKSEGDRLFCLAPDCGFEVRMNEYGFLEGEDAPYDDLTRWDEAQAEKLLAIADSAEGNIFTDTDMELREILPDHKVELLGLGDMAMDAEAMTVCGQRFEIEKISGMALHGAQTIDFTCEGRNYEISSGAVRCGRKYLTVYEHLKKRDAGI